MKNFFSPPTLSTPELTRRGADFFEVAWISFLLIAFSLAGRTITQPDLAMRSLETTGVAGLYTIALLALNRRGHVTTAGILLIGANVLLMTQRALSSGGIHAPGIARFCVISLMAGLLLGEVGGLATAVTCGAICLGLVVADHIGLIHQTAFYNDYTLWWMNLLYMATTVLLLRVATRSLKRAYRRSQEDLDARRKTEERLHVALAAGAIGTWEADLSSGRFSADERMAQMLSITPDPDGTISLERWRKVVHPADLPTMDAIIADLVRGVPYPKANYRLLRANGEVRHMEVTSLTARSESGRITHVGTLMDVTEKQQAAEEREKLLMQLHERVKELRVLHFAAKILHDRPFEKAVLDELAVLLPQGFAHHETCEARITFNDMQAATPGWRDTSWRLSAPFCSTAGNGVVEVVYLHARPQASEGPFWAEERILLNSFVEMLVSYLDKHEADRRKAALEAKLQASQRMEAMGTLAGGIAHDFNNLLAAIQGFAGLLEEDCAPGSSSRHFAGRIRSACERGSHMVKQILSFARTSRVEREVLDLSALVRESQEFLSQTVPAGTRIIFPIPDEAFCIHANPGQLSQLLTNLCRNAGEALEDGPGKIEITLHKANQLPDAAGDRTGRGRMIVGDLRTDRSYVALTVRDNGPGIAQDVLARIFDPFFTTKEARRGSGLGLAVVQRVVDAHNGGCLVETGPQGTSFTIFLPLSQLPAKLPGPLPSCATFSRFRILLVDDDIEVLDSTALALERLGQDVVAIDDPIEALDMFRGDCTAWDIAVVDQRMPSMLGTDLVRELKTINPALMAILCTGHSDRLELGLADACLQKPVEARRLMEEIEKLAKNRHVAPALDSAPAQ